MDKQEALQGFKDIQKLFVKDTDLYNALNLAIAALSDRGYEQGYKDGQEQALASIGHVYDKNQSESVTTTGESVMAKCPICEHEMCFYVKDKRTSYCKCKCGHAYIWISGKLL